LPVDLPHLDDYKPIGKPEPPLGKAPESWLYPVIDGRRYRRETNTMPQWAGSCWYYLRFIDPQNDTAFVDRRKEKAWMPVDLYVGGAEHAVLHLLYARFWHKVLFDRGYVSTIEPFQKLVNQGMILGEVEFTGYKSPSGQWISAQQVVDGEDGQALIKGTTTAVSPRTLAADDVEKQGDCFVLKTDPTIRVDSRAHKMSKARGNVVNPNDIVAKFGADALRLYEMFMGPLEEVKPWNTQSISGVRGFLDRAWRLIVDDKAETVVLNAAVQQVAPTPDQDRALHRAIEGVTRDLERMAFNTAIAKMMEFVNFFTKESVRPQSALERFVLLLGPFAPHLAEELWQILGHKNTLAYEPWPSYDEALLKSDTIEIPVQINGKVRETVTVAAQCSQDEMLAAAKANARIAELIAGKTVVKEVVVPKRLVNFVVK